MKAHTTTIFSSNGSLNLKYVYNPDHPSFVSCGIVVFSSSFGLLALGTSCTSIPSECPSPCGKKADEMPEARIDSKLFQEPELGDVGDLKRPSFWKPPMRTLWQSRWTVSQCTPGLIISKARCWGRLENQ